MLDVVRLDKLLNTGAASHSTLASSLLLGTHCCLNAKRAYNTATWDSQNQLIPLSIMHPLHTNTDSIPYKAGV